MKARQEDWNEEKEGRKDVAQGATGEPSNADHVTPPPPNTHTPGTPELTLHAEAGAAG